jgi:hypothetical protein
MTLFNFKVPLPLKKTGQKTGPIFKKESPKFFKLNLRFFLNRNSMTHIDIPKRFQHSKSAERLYIILINLFHDVSHHRNQIQKIRVKFSLIPDVILLDLSVKQFIDKIIDCRRKYVIATWSEADTERLFHEMKTDISELCKTYVELGKRYKCVCSLCI